MTKRQLHRYHTHMLACAARGIEPPSVVKVEICLFAVCHLVCEFLRGFCIRLKCSYIGTHPHANMCCKEDSNLHPSYIKSKFWLL